MMADMMTAGPPPSFALESSSGEDDFDEVSGKPLPSKPLKSTPVQQLTIKGSLEKGCDVIFLVGEAGQRMSKGIASTSEKESNRLELIPVYIEDEVVAFVHNKMDTSQVLVFITPDIKIAQVHLVTCTLLTKLSPKSTTIITNYHYPSYVGSTDSSSTLTIPRILYLTSSSSSSSLSPSSTPLIPSSLKSSDTLFPYTPPNLLHGLSSSLLTLSALSNVPTLMILLPTATTPQPLNGPFRSPSNIGWSNFAYDAGGPTNLSEEGNLFKELIPNLKKIKKELGWSTWWNEEVVKEGVGYEILVKARREYKRLEVGSMYM